MKHLNTKSHDGNGIVTKLCSVHVDLSASRMNPTITVDLCATGMNVKNVANFGNMMKHTVQVGFKNLNNFH